MNSYRWTILGVGTAAQAAFSAVAVGLPALAPALRSTYHLSLGQIGVVLGAVGIGSLPTLLAWGLVADRVGERAVIAIGVGGGGLTLAASGWSHGFAALTGWLVLTGMLGSSVNAASGRAVMGWFGAEERGLALGIRQSAMPMGGACAAASLPWLAHHGGTKLAFVALGAGCVVTATVAAVLLRGLPPGAAEAAPALRPGPLRDRAIWLLSLGSALYVAAQIAVLTFLVLFLHEHRGMSAGAAAAVLAVLHLLGIVARITVGRWSDRRRARLAPLRALGLALAAGMVLTALLVDAPLVLLVPAIVVAGVLGLAWNGLSFTATAETAGRARSGAALGFQQTALAVSVAFVPIAFAAMVKASSWRVAFALAALAPVAGWLALRRVPEPTPATRPPDERSRGTSVVPPGAR